MINRLSTISKIIGIYKKLCISSSVQLSSFSYIDVSVFLPLPFMSVSCAFGEMTIAIQIPYVAYSFYPSHASDNFSGRWSLHFTELYPGTWE